MISSENLTMYDYIYLSLAKKILADGELRENRTGVRAYSLPQVCFKVDLTDGKMPILGSKFVPFKTAVKELLWIWKDQSNNVQELRDAGVNIWNEWEREDGTIGKAYGYQLRKFKQVDRLIETLKTDPESRRMVVTLWNNEDLDEMALYPCAFETLWNVNKGKLNCTLIIRSNDWFLGNPFNVLQYAVLVCMIAQVTGYKPRELMVVVNDAHIYENHVDQINEQIKDGYNYELFYSIGAGEGLAEPKLVLNPEIKNFYDFTIDDIKLEGYTPGPKRVGQVAV